MINLAHIWRHPIKSHGREQLNSVELTAGIAMPNDRRFAIAHARAKISDDWMACQNFNRGSKLGALNAIECHLDDKNDMITLSHFEHGSIIANPNTDDGAKAILDFALRVGDNLDFVPTKFLELKTRAYTDTDYPSISILSHSSLRDLSKRANYELNMERWRGNLWMDGASAWDEATWIGKQVEIGDTILQIIEPIGRCSMTTHNPATGAKDFDTLKLLRDEFGHQNFGVYAKVMQGGTINIGDKLVVLS